MTNLATLIKQSNYKPLSKRLISLQSVVDIIAGVGADITTGVVAHFYRSYTQVDITCFATYFRCLTIIFLHLSDNEKL